MAQTVLTRMPLVTLFGWIVLALVFVDELLAVAALGIWGWQAPPDGLPGWVLVWLVPLLATTAWFLLASPKAAYGGPIARPLTKVVVFGLASLALWGAGHQGWALALLVFSVVVNGLAQLGPVRALLTPER